MKIIMKRPVSVQIDAIDHQSLDLRMNLNVDVRPPHIDEHQGRKLLCELHTDGF